MRIEIRVVGDFNLEKGMEWVVMIEEKLISHYGPTSYWNKSLDYRPRPSPNCPDPKPYKSKPFFFTLTKLPS